MWLAMLLLPLLLAFAGLAVDIAYMYVVKNSLQVSADSSALAGAALIGDMNDLTQSSARNEAFDYALKNTAAGSPVQLASDGSNVLSSDNDITVGFWDTATGSYSAGQTPVNAMEVRPRRTSDSPGGPASVFWGPILSFFGRSWSVMSAAAQAIAVRPPLTTPGISLCVRSCEPEPVTGNFIVQTDNKNVGIINGMAWTVFDCNASVNANDVKDFIWGRRQSPAPLCGRCIATQNGVSALTGQDGFADAFASSSYDKANKTFDAGGNVTSWKVVVPIIESSCDTFDSNCNMGSLGSSETCPPGAQSMGGFDSREPSHVVQLAVITITAVTTTGGEKGITLSNSQCIPCYDPVHFVNAVILLK
ncbi:MAG: pilus assembly protein TadG-related protein [Candidatus Sulfobium sp.]